MLLWGVIIPVQELFCVGSTLARCCYHYAGLPEATPEAASLPDSSPTAASGLALRGKV